MRKARLLQSVAILALALTFAPADSRGQSATDSGSQGYPTYGYGMPGSGSYDQQQFRTGSEQRPYGAADQYGVDRSFDRYGNQIWPQQAFDQPQGFPSPQSRGYGQGQQFGGPAYGPYGPQGAQRFGQFGQQAFGQQDWQQRYGQQDWRQRYPQQAQGGAAFDSDMGRQSDPQSRFGYEQPGGAEDFYGRSAQDRWLEDEMRRRQQAHGDSFGARGMGAYSGEGYGPGAERFAGQGYGMGGQAYGVPHSMGDRQMGAGPGQYPAYPYGQAYGAPYGQGWQDQQRFGMQGQFQQDGRFAEGRGRLDRFGYEGGYPEFGRYQPGQPGQQAYGQFDRRRMMDQGGMMGMQGGMDFDQQAYGATRPGREVQQPGAEGGRIEVVSAGELVGRSVTDSSGREIGTSRYLVIGAQSGKVHFVMVGSGAEDQFDLGTDLLPVPWRVVDAGQDQRIALSIPADRLRELPRVPPSELASVVGPQIVGQIRQWITASPDQATGGSAGQDTSGASTATTAQPSTQQQATGTAQSGTQSQTQTATGDTAQSGQTTTGTGGTTPSTTGGQTQTSQSQQAQAGGQQQAGSQIASADPGAGLGAAEEEVVVLGGRYRALVAPPTLMTEGELAGTTVFSADGVPIGDIDEILIDRRRGQVAYVLVSTGGFLGTDQRWLPVPFTAMTWMPTRMGFALRIQSSQLATLPELAQGTPPRFIRGRDLAHLYYAYGAEPYWMRPGAGTSGAVDDRG